VPFGEYIPWVEDAAWLKQLFLHYISPYDFDYTVQPGKSFTVFDGPPALDAGSSAAAPAADTSQAVRIAAPICFEDVYPDVIQQMVYGQAGQKRADLVVNLTNDGWFLFRYDAPWLHHWYSSPVAWLVGWLGASHQGIQELQAAAFRCVENRVPMVRSVNTGISGFIASSGRVGPLLTVDGRTQDVDGYISCRVALDPRTTFFGQAGQWPMAVLQICTAIWVLGGFFRTGKMDGNSRR
jgi:apolipoprotein N-acyltransferase